MMKYLVYIFIISSLIACKSEPDLHKFDVTKIKDIYVNDPVFLYEEYIKKDYITRESLKRGYRVLSAKNIPIIRFKSPSEFTIKIFNPFRPHKADIRYDYEYKIKNDSIVFVKLLNVDDSNYSNNFEEYAILLSYTKDYDHLIFKPTKGILKGLPIKVTHREKSLYGTKHLNIFD